MIIILTWLKLQINFDLITLAAEVAENHNEKFIIQIFSFFRYVGR